MPFKLRVVDEAIVVGIFSDNHGWASRCAGARAVIQGRAVMARCTVTIGVSEGRSDGDRGARRRGVHGQWQTIGEHVCGDGAVEQLVTVLVGDD
ncbi:hypothetical protein [Shewanella nanhaiensis]|uniref:Uncharacterized protein n=1 Tax=Shewanella nanhaiensis TaxID=2864872 RepID=A0ABS7EAN4_9GAMM|nr:hypothetical protein [Shewanella nanhaiensis]MBW8186726.1 hypothetical protein [Shewanella nanhaiensis]